MMKHLNCIFLFFLLIFSGSVLHAQPPQAEPKPSKVMSQKTAVNKLQKAVSTSDDRSQAEAYVALADNYERQNLLAKSEENLQKAKLIYAQLNDKANLALITRKLAQIQETQNKINSAAKNYESAAKYSVSTVEADKNRNDYSRVVTSAPAVKEKALEDNIALNSNNSAELAKDYSNLADVNIQQNNIPKATENLNNAYEISRNSQPEQALAINKKMTDLYVNNKDFGKAIETQKKVLQEGFVKSDSQENVAQMQELADIYLQADNVDEAEKLLSKAYQIAVEKGHTLEAQKSVLKLDSLYQSQGNSGKAIQLYKNFLGELPNLLNKDRSLVDSKLMKDTEDKIAQLEKEKGLHEQIVKKKNLFNYLLIAGLIFAIAFSAFALYTQKKLKTQNKKIELQSLRREMNPHFIFNSLNSVNQFIAENNELEANSYLTKFSKLMRGVMENSKEDFIPIAEELDLLRNYLALEKSRFQDKFNYEIVVEDGLQNTNLQIPGMLVQPFLENAIWHGLRYKSEIGFLKLAFSMENQQLKITVEDNGIGIENSKAQKTVHQKQRNGRGMKNTMERIDLLNDLYHKNIQCEVVDKTDEHGVLVTIKMNLVQP